MAPKLVILLSLLHISLQSDYVPVVLWGDKSVNLKESLVGQTISESEFHNNYLNDLSNENERSLILFAQKQLSTEDLAKYSDAYNEKSDGGPLKHLKDRVENSVSRQLISVENPVNVILGFGRLNKFEKFRIDSLDKLPKLNNNKRIFLVVDLPDNVEKTDELIELVLKAIEQNNKKYIAIYTGKASSSTDNAIRYGRHLLATGESNAENGTAIEFDCGLIYMTRRSVEVISFGKNGKSDKIEGETKLTKKPVCNKKEQYVNFEIQFKNASKQLDLTLKFIGNFTAFSRNSSNYFYLRNYSVAGTYEGKKLNENGNRIDYVAPGRSYHCKNFDVGFLIVDTKDAKEDRTYVSFTINDFQLEIGKNKIKKFSYPEDCAGFFSGPIWSGLFVTSILTGILVFGIIMIIDIKVMDRFDDPKGKQLNLGKTEN